MKNIFLSIIFVIFASPVFAGSCPMLWGELDSEIKIAKQSGMSSDKVDLIKKLRAVSYTHLTLPTNREV